MNDNDLTVALRELGDAAPPTTTPISDDLARGRTALRRRRAGQAVVGTAAATVVAAAAVFGASLTRDTPRPVTPAGSSTATAATAPDTWGTGGIVPAMDRHLWPQGRPMAPHDRVDVSALRMTWFPVADEPEDSNRTVGMGIEPLTTAAHDAAGVWLDLRKAAPDCTAGTCTTVQLGGIEVVKTETPMARGDGTAVGYWHRNTLGWWLHLWVWGCDTAARTCETLAPEAVGASEARVGQLLADPELNLMVDAKGRPIEDPGKPMAAVPDAPADDLLTDEELDRLARSRSAEARVVAEVIDRHLYPAGAPAEAAPMSRAAQQAKRALEFMDESGNVELQLVSVGGRVVPVGNRLGAFVVTFREPSLHPCPDGQSGGTPGGECREVVLGGVTVVKVFDAHGAVTGYWHRTSSGQWISGRPELLAPESGSFQTAQPSDLGFTEDRIGPLLADPALAWSFDKQ